MAGFVLGVIGVVLCWVPVLGVGLAVLAIVLSGSGMASAKGSNAPTGLGIAGLVLGIVALIPSLFMVLLFANF